MTITTEKKIQLLQETREFLKKFGWYQGRFTGPNNSRCLIGAVAGAAGDRGDYDVTEPVNNELRKEIERTGYAGDRRGDISVAKWNDEPGRTVEEVYGLIDRTISRLAEDLGPDPEDLISHEEALAREHGANTSYDERD